MTLQLHLDGCQRVNFKDDTNLQSIADSHYFSRTMLTEFFWMNAHDEHAKAAKLFYADFPSQFVWLAQSKTWKIRQRDEVIGRLVAVHPNQGDIYYLRLLLAHVPAPTSYNYLKTVNGILYSSNKEAAVALGLLEDDDSNEKCMQKACMYRMPTSLRQLFCTILVYCSPTNPKELFLKFEEDLAHDYVAVQHLTKDQARQQLLQVLNLELQSMGKSLADFDLLSLLAQQNREEKVCREIQDELDILVSEIDIAAVALLNQEQKHAYSEILNAVFGHQ